METTSAFKGSLPLFFSALLGRFRLSLDAPLPFGTVGRVFEDDAAGGQFVADRVGPFEVLGLARRFAFGDKGFDFLGF